MKNPLVVGYRGEIGSYILGGLIKYMPSATPILCFDIHESKKEKIEKVKKADVIFLCVPLEETLHFFKSFEEYLSGKTVVEQTSLKSILFKDGWVDTFLVDIKVLSMHILFRPSATPNFKDRSLAIVEPRKWQNRKLVEKFVMTLASKVHLYSHYKTHDYDMAYQQALVHRVILSLDRALKSSMCDQRTYLGERIRELAHRINTGDKELYKLIQTNEYIGLATDHFQDEFKDFQI